MKRFIPIVATLALLVGLVLPPVAYDAAEDTTTGSFTTENAAPTINWVELWTTGGTPAETTFMDPQAVFNVKVNVTDNNTLADLNTVKVVIYLDTDGVFNLLDVPVSGDTHTAAILNCAVGTPAPGCWSIDPNSSTTWDLLEGNCVKPTLSSSAGTFEFYFQPGMVATAEDNWFIYAIATDLQDDTDDEHLDNLTMNWYGQITVGPDTVDWGSVLTGTGFGDNVNEEGSIQVAYIANGGYESQVKSGSTWDGDPLDATFDEDGSCSAHNEFSLMAYPIDTFSSAVQVTTAGATIGNGGLTDDVTGNVVATNTMWLKLATVFNYETYSGTITYIITN